MIQQNIVIIDTSVAHLIADDLVKGDECLKEIELVRANLDLTIKEVTLKDSIINTLGKQKDGLNLIISKKDEMFSKQEEISKTYKAELSKQKGISLLYKILAFAGIGSTGYLILKH